MALAAAALTAPLLGACHSGSSSAKDKTAAPTAFAPRPTTYRIVYHVTQPDSPGSERWEELTVRRPFEARDAVFQQRPAPGTQPFAGTLATTDHLILIQEGGKLQELSGRQPSSPTGDQALAVELDEAERRKIAGPPGVQRTIAGRTCQDHPFLEPPAGVIKALTGGDRDLVCIDHDGLVLREEWKLKGKVALLREAETVDLAPADVDTVLSPAAAAPSPEPAGVPQIVDPSTVGRVIADPAPPGGFTQATKVGFLMIGEPQMPSTPPPILYTSTVWGFARGGDSITIEAGASGSGPPPWLDSDLSRDVDLPMGKAQSVLRSDGPELRVVLTDGKWVRIRGTVPIDALEAYARTLPRPA